MMLKAVVIEQNGDGAKTVRDMFESDKCNLTNLLKKVKRELVQRPPENRTVTIEVKDDTDSTVFNKQWTVPGHYVG